MVKHWKIRIVWKTLESIGKAMENIGRHWKTLEDIGKHWEPYKYWKALETLESIGKHWKHREDSENIGNIGKYLRTLSLAGWLYIAGWMVG